MLIDTNVFIELERKNPKALEFFLNTQNKATSVIVLMELLVGFKKKAQIGELHKLIRESEINVINITESISLTAYSILSKNYHKNNTSIHDSLIAATALAYDEEFITLNVKHFDKISGLKVTKPF